MAENDANFVHNGVEDDNDDGGESREQSQSLQV